MRDGHVDVAMLLRANEPGQYPNRTASTDSQKLLRRADDRLRWDGQCRAESPAGSGGHGPHVC